MVSLFLALGAIIPGVILLVFIFRKDRADKEPAGLLLKLLALGAVIVFPVVFVSGPVNGFIQSLFATGFENGSDLSGMSYYLYQFIYAFFGVALIEEGFKWLVLYLVTKSNKNFNSLFDGIIYAVFVSLGFAIFENILYVFESGFTTAIMRAFTAVPGHMFFGVIMGYYYTLWHAQAASDKIEKHFISRGLLPSSANAFRPQPKLVLSIIMPVVAHGIYDFCCFVAEGWSITVFYIFLAGLYVYCFKTINKMSKTDMGDFNYSVLAFNQKYPQLQSELVEYVKGVMAAKQAAGVGSAAYVSNQGAAYTGAPGNVQGGSPYTAQGGSPYTQPVSNPYATQGGSPYTAQGGSPYTQPVSNPYATQGGSPYAAQDAKPYNANGNVPPASPYNQGLTPDSPGQGLNQQ